MSTEPELMSDEWWEQHFGIKPIPRNEDGSTDWPAFAQQLLDENDE